MENPTIGLTVEPKVIGSDNIKCTPGEITGILDWEVKDPDGTVVSRGMKKMESFVQQFMDLLLASFLDTPGTWPMSIKDTSGVMQDVTNNIVNWQCNALANDPLFGIIVGTGVAAPTITDFVIGTIINHGAGAGQLQYGAVTFGAPASDATTSQFTITRNFANASGGTVTPTEIALYVKATTIPIMTNYTFALSAYFMTIRDVIGGGGIAVLNGQTLTINYRPQVII